MIHLWAIDGVATKGCCHSLRSESLLVELLGGLGLLDEFKSLLHCCEMDVVVESSYGSLVNFVLSFDYSPTV